MKPVMTLRVTTNNLYYARDHPHGEDNALARLLFRPVILGGFFFISLIFLC